VYFASLPPGRSPVPLEPSPIYFEADTTLLDAAQAACIALPAAGVPAVLLRAGGRGWALVAPLSIVVSLGAIALSSAGEDVLTWVSLLLVPPGCALAFGWAAHGARPWLATLAVLALAAALAGPEDPLGRAGRLVLIAGSCVTVGRLLAGAAPLALLKAGVLAMAAIDSVVIFGELFEEHNARFDAAVPAAGLPRLQVAEIGDASIDYGDFFVAGLVGGILAAERRPQLAAALAMFLLAQAFNQLFLVVESLPGTVPPALVLLAFEAYAGLRGSITPLSHEAPPSEP
jgi:hypothetical protein